MPTALDDFVSMMSHYRVRWYLGVPSLGALLDLLLFACHLRAWISALESKPNERGAAEHANVLAAGDPNFNINP